MLKPQDIVVLLKLRRLSRDEWTYESLASDLAMSQSEVHQAVRRVSQVDLYDADRWRVRPHPLLNFLIHGVRYVFGARPGRTAVGIPTAYSAAPLAEQLIVNEDDIVVWPDKSGTATGRSVQPLYKSVTRAVREDPQLHEDLALVDAIRIGKARERSMAVKELERRLVGVG